MSGVWGTLSCGLFAVPLLSKNLATGQGGLVYTGSFAMPMEQERCWYYSGTYCALGNALPMAIGARIGAGSLVERAAALAMADLMTAMVGEFPELQGLMGRYYALEQGIDAEVADGGAEERRRLLAGQVQRAAVHPDLARTRDGPRQIHNRD